jgi:hypothetical protein
MKHSESDTPWEQARGALLAATGAFDALKFIGADAHLPGFDHTLAQVEAAIKRLEEVPSEKRDMVLVPRKFLEATTCPNCDGSGYITNTGPDPLHEPCLWCEEKHMILSGAERA